jgi:Ser/Thr protein kinase RdoA (MazF antagonist)
VATSTANDPWTAPLAPVDAALAAGIAACHFGLTATATPLVSERDHNFELRDGDGRRYVLKLTHPAEPQASTHFQTRAMVAAAARDPALPIPQLLPAADGRAWAEVELAGARRIARIMTLLPGLPLWRVPLEGPAQHRAIGAALARLHLALAAIDCNGAPADLLWDLRRAPLLHELLPRIADGTCRSAVGGVLQRLAAAVLPALAQLPAQAVHNDFQPWNLLVDEADPTRITGIIDFGDAVAAPPVMDLAVACAYHVADAPTAAPLTDLQAVVQGYESLRPLTPEERSLLLPLTAGRMAMTLAITSWRATLHPDNAAYILRNAGAAWTGLQRLIPQLP